MGPKPQNDLHVCVYIYVYKYLHVYVYEYVYEDVYIHVLCLCDAGNEMLISEAEGAHIFPSPSHK